MTTQGLRMPGQTANHMELPTGCSPVPCRGLVAIGQQASFWDTEIVKIYGGYKPEKHSSIWSYGWGTAAAG